MTNPSIVDEMSLRMAREIVQTWRSFRDPKREPQIKARIQVAIAKLIVDELLAETNHELRGD
jgi:hypothetical protein